MSRWHVAAWSRKSGACVTAILSGLLGIVLCGTALAQPARAQADTKDTLTVGIAEAPPFVIRNEDGTWSGISIDLWREIADEMELPFEYRELPLEQLFTGVSDGSLDIAVGPLTILASREKVMDFTQPYYRTGLAIAVPQHGHGFFTLISGVIRWPLMHVMLSLLAVLLLVSAVVWFLERKDNYDQFGGPGLAGIWSAFWWAVSTMTTVGYGDKAPVTVLGRAVAILWMFSGVLIISSFTATITTALAMQHFGSSIRGPGDLEHVWVATVKGTTSDTYLRDNGVRVKYYPDVVSGLRAVAADEVDAMVYDEPLLNYASTHALPGQIEVLPGTFDEENYGFALPLASHLRKLINVVLLEKLHDPFWKRITTLYLGK